jgi:predicted phage-related endonuclease
MIVKHFDDRDAWLAERDGKVTGSTLKDIIVKRGNGRKIGSYELIAKRLGATDDGENPMERGHRLESEAVACFEAMTGKQVHTALTMWQGEPDANMAVSPDGYILPEGDGKITEAVEVKCLSSARHIEALLTQEVPSEYEYQKLQYFVVNPDLQTLHFCFYDPRLSFKRFHVIRIDRKDVQEDVDFVAEYQRKELEWVEETVKSLTSF